jgi:hypothetical protein
MENTDRTFSDSPKIIPLTNNPPNNINSSEISLTLDEMILARQYIREELEDIIYVLQLPIALELTRDSAVNLIHEEIMKL